MIFIPFQISFEYDPQDNLLRFEFIKNTVFILDILLMFHTAINHEGHLILKRRIIMKSYLKGYFFFDLIGSLPYREIIGPSIFYTSEAPDKFTRMILLFRCARFIRGIAFISKMKEKMLSQVVTGIMSLLKLLLYIIFLAHIVACIWHFVGMLVYNSYSQSWISAYGFLDESIGERYVASLYWTLLTMITVGYGDITPVTMVERLVTVFAMLLGCGMFGYSMNSIGILLQNINERKNKKR